MSNAMQYIVSQMQQSYPTFVFTDDGLILDMNRLALQFIEQLGSNDMSPRIFFDLLNRLCESDNQEIWDIVEVGFLEILTDTKLAQDTTYNYLSGRALRLFDNLFKERFRRL